MRSNPSNHKETLMIKKIIAGLVITLVSSVLIKVIVDRVNQKA